MNVWTRHRWPGRISLLFALCLPLVFLHADYQPSLTVGVASSEATLFRSDVAVLAAGVVALLAGRAPASACSGAGRAIWIAPRRSSP